MTHTNVVAGIDEVGRGPLAGPVTAACIVLDPKYSGLGVKDSKALSEKKREKLFTEIQNNALALSVVSVGARRIEKINIREASLLAMKLSAERVEKQLNERFSNISVHYLIDGNATIATNCSQEAIIKGDQKVLAISAASIIAKVTRDRLMKKMEKYYPGYGFSTHKGYPTKAHKQQITDIGPCSIHRKTFSGVKEHISGRCLK